MNAKKQLMETISDFDAFALNSYADEQVAQMPVMGKSMSSPTELKGQRGMPLFTAQFDVNLITAVVCFKIPFERDPFRFKPFGTFRETTFKQVRNSSLGTLC